MDYLYNEVLKSLNPDCMKIFRIVAENTIYLEIRIQANWNLFIERVSGKLITKESN